MAAHIVLDALELFPVIAPCHDIAVRTDGNQPLAVRLVQILLNPCLLYTSGFSALDGIPGKKTVMESTANHIAFNFIIGRTGLVSVSYTHLDVYKRQNP